MQFKFGNILYWLVEDIADLMQIFLYLSLCFKTVGLYFSVTKNLYVTLKKKLKVQENFFIHHEQSQHNSINTLLNNWLKIIHQFILLTIRLATEIIKGNLYWIILYIIGLEQGV